MKYDIYFVHGWGFGKNFWKPVQKKIEKDKFSRHIFNIDLNFFDEYENLVGSSESNDNKIYIVHSYGLNWFLKKNFKCKVLINFFGLPDFIGFQERPNFVRFSLDRMLSEFIYNPEKVIEKFYDKCEVKCDYMKNFNKKKLTQALINLKSNNLKIKFTNAEYNVFSIFSHQDKVLNIDIEKIKKIETENHQVSVIPNLCHGFPLANPDTCYEMIKNFIQKV